jgi:hypothetical protein
MLYNRAGSCQQRQVTKSLAQAIGRTLRQMASSGKKAPDTLRAYALKSSSPAPLGYLRMILLGALAAVVGFGLQRNVLTDDAAMSFRYVDRIVAGHGFTYNEHEHFVRPDLEIARSRPGSSVTLSELPPEPLGEDGGLQNLEIQANGAMYADPPSGATFAIKNKARPESLTFTPSFVSDVSAERPMASRSRSAAEKSAFIKVVYIQIILCFRSHSTYPKPVLKTS